MHCIVFSGERNLQDLVGQITLFEFGPVLAKLTRSFASGQRRVRRAMIYVRASSLSAMQIATVI